MTDKATPGPWPRPSDEGWLEVKLRPIWREDAFGPDDPDYAEARANAALIVTAVNAYDAMREALRQAEQSITRRLLHLRQPGDEALLKTITAALAAAEGKVIA